MMHCPVYLLHPVEARFSAAVVARCIQLAEIGDRYLSERYSFVLRAVPADGGGAWAVDLRGGIAMLTAGLARHLPLHAAERLRRGNRALIADWGDRPVAGPAAEAVDLHVFGALEAYRRGRAD